MPALPQSHYSGKIALSANIAPHMPQPTQTHAPKLVPVMRATYSYTSMHNGMTAPTSITPQYLACTGAKRITHIYGPETMHS
jgi:hypothetical protein